MAGSNLQHIYFFVQQNDGHQEAEVPYRSNSTSRSQSPTTDNGSTSSGSSNSTSHLNPAAIDFTPNGYSITPPPTASQLFELRKIEGKGMGLVATTFIPIGTRIICESPLLRIDNNSVDLAWGPYCRLSNANKKAYDALHFFKPGHMELEAVSRATLIDNSDRSMDDDDINELVQDQVRVMGIFACNNFQSGPQSLAVFESTSRLNHSCIPNVHHSWNPTLKKQTVHAVRDIQPGEELCTTYLGGQGSYYVRAQRIERLRKHYGFTCTCQACSDITGQGDGRREAMGMLAYGLQLYMQGGQSQVPYVPTSDYDALEKAEGLVELLIMEGLVAIELCKAYRTASMRAMAINDFDRAMEYAFNEQEVERNCLGKEVDDLDKIQASASSWIGKVRGVASKSNITLSDRFRSRNKHDSKTSEARQRRNRKKKERKALKNAEKAEQKRDEQKKAERKQAEQKKAEVVARKQKQEEGMAKKKEKQEQEKKQKEFETAWPALKS